MALSRILRCFLLVGGLTESSLANAREFETLPPGPAAECPALAPNGQQFAFVSDAAGDDDIWIASRDGTGARSLVRWSASTESCPDWFPVGSRVVFASNRGGSSFNIWSVDANGANALQLTSGAGENTHPRVSPDGARIVFLSNRTGKRELWLMKVDGTSQQAIKLLPERISDPTWSPDGKEIAYVGCADADGTCNVFAITIDSAIARRITSGAFYDWQPDWSPNGIVFASDRNGTQGLWVVDATGSNFRSLTAPSGTGDMYPRWESNGTGGVIFSRSSTGDDPASSNIWLRDAQGGEIRATRIVGFSPALVGAASRKAHGAGDTFDLPLAATATSPTTEPRSGGAGGNHTLVFTFDKPVTSGTAVVSGGTGTAGLVTFSGSEMIVPISGVANQQYLTLTVSDVSGADGSTGGAGRCAWASFWAT